jgi:hyperosmotically inducible protein
MRRPLFASCLLLAALAFAAPAAADQPADAWITSKVKAALLTDDVVNGLDVNVDTTEGRVTLHGAVASEQQKERAEKRAREIEGVTQVENLLSVGKGKARERIEVADGELKESVEKALENDRALASSDIEVASVSGGVVKLEGDVETVAAERRALARARAVPGVRRVVSELRGPRELTDREIWQEENASADAQANPVADAWLTTKVKVALMSEEGVDATSVNVDTEDAVVTLFGRVDSDQAKQAAEARARNIEGVKRVENELVVGADVAASGEGAKDDDAINEAVRKRIEQRTNLADADIDVSATGGVVRLSGTVQSQRDRVEALTAARAAQGVRSVVDNLKIAAAQ